MRRGMLPFHLQGKDAAVLPGAWYQFRQDLAKLPHPAFLELQAFCYGLFRQAN